MLHAKQTPSLLDFAIFDQQFSQKASLIIIIRIKTVEKINIL